MNNEVTIIFIFSFYNIIILFALWPINLAIYPKTPMNVHLLSANRIAAISVYSHTQVNMHKPDSL